MAHVSLIAPSSPSPQEDVDLTKQYLEDLNIRVTVPPDLLGKDLLCAHQDEVRFAHLKNALQDPSVDIVWLLRGGYGLTRLIQDLLKMKRPNKEKLFIGFSDGSVLHVFLNQKWNWPSLHGPGASQLSRAKVGQKTIEATLQFLKEGMRSYSPPVLTPFNNPARKISSLSGSLAGGNLCLLTCSLGTDWQLNSSGKILFLEDIDERGYRVDRMLMHLEQARTFEGVQAIILGDFVRGNEANGTSLIHPVLKRFAENTPLPVFSLPGCGHGDENFPLPFNTPLTFSVAQE
ncbi:MAG: LD-carboxypeptidase [Proteobacteria bacterium]|nr:LD-carboxypeptidase [Pseudomonadota bacterium]